MNHQKPALHPSASLSLPPVLIDATHGVLGRIASFAAKQALIGKRVVIVHCGKSVISGRPRTTIGEYNSLRRRGGSSQNGPFFPKNPSRIMKRTIRGMLPHLKQRGVDALKRVMCYEEVPKHFASMKMHTFHHTLKAKTITLDSLSKEI